MTFIFNRSVSFNADKMVHSHRHDSQHEDSSLSEVLRSVDWYIVVTGVHKGFFLTDWSRRL